MPDIDVAEQPLASITEAMEYKRVAGDPDEPGVLRIVADAEDIVGSVTCVAPSLYLTVQPDAPVRVRLSLTFPVLHSVVSEVVVIVAVGRVSISIEMTFDMLVQQFESPEFTILLYHFLAVKAGGL